MNAGFVAFLHFSEKYLRLFSFNRKYSVFLRPDYRAFYPCLVVGKRFFLPWPALANGNSSIPRPFSERQPTPSRVRQIHSLGLQHEAGFGWEMIVQDIMKAFIQRCVRDASNLANSLYLILNVATVDAQGVIYPVPKNPRKHVLCLFGSMRVRRGIFLHGGLFISAWALTLSVQSD